MECSEGTWNGDCLSLSQPFISHSPNLSVTLLHKHSISNHENLTLIDYKPLEKDGSTIKYPPPGINKVLLFFYNV